MHSLGKLVPGQGFGHGADSWLEDDELLRGFFEQGM